MRASAAYRRKLLGNLLQRAWLAHHSTGVLRLEDLVVDAVQPKELP